MAVQPINRALRLSAIIAALTLTGCTSSSTIERPPWPDMQEVARMLDCPIGRTPTCVERINKPYSCFCADEDAMRAIFEPDGY